MNAAPTHVAFDGFTLERATGDLWKGDMRRRLQQQPLQILDELLAAPGQLVTRERLIARLWPKGVVDFDTGLNTAMRKLRLALGDDSNRPRYIETLPRKGYRFIARFEAVEAPPNEVPAAAGAASVKKPAAAPAAPTRDRAAVGARARPRRLWTAAIASLGCAALLTAWIAGRSSASSSPSSAGSSAVARDGPPSLAYDLYLAASARQTEISPFEGAEPRRRVLELLDRALAIDPSFAPAYVVRARTNLDCFISNSDVTDELLAAIRRDLQKARELSGNNLIGADVQSLYAALVDMDPERGLRLADAVANDPLVQQSKAMILMTLGRFRESDEIFDRFLALDPANQRLLRIEYSNLLAERRGTEALRLIDTLQRVSPPGRNPWLLPRAASVDLAGPSFPELRDALRAPDPDGERLLRLSAGLGIMRTERRYGEIRELLDSVHAESMRVAPFTGALPGLGRMPVAALRGWNDLLRGDAVAAAANGREVFDFVARQPATKWNPWYRRMLEAEAQVFSGNAAAAVAAVQEALLVPSRRLVNRNLQVYREYLAAITLAWAGEHDRSVELLERLSTGAPSVEPAVIARDPLLSTPLQGTRAMSGFGPRSRQRRIVRLIGVMLVGKFGERSRASGSPPRQPLLETAASSSLQDRAARLRHGRAPIRAAGGFQRAPAKRFCTTTNLVVVAPDAAPASLSMSSRRPSGATSYCRTSCGVTYRFRSSTLLGVPQRKSDPVSIGSATSAVGLKKYKVRPSRAHFGSSPPPAETCHLPPATSGNGRT